MLAEGRGNVLAAFDIPRGGLDRLFHDDVAHGLRNDLENFQNRHTAADERGKGAGKPRQANFMSDAAEDRQANAVFVPKEAAAGGLDEVKPGVHETAAAQKDEQQVFFDNIYLEKNDTLYQFVNKFFHSF